MITDFIKMPRKERKKRNFLYINVKYPSIINSHKYAFNSVILFFFFFFKIIKIQIVFFFHPLIFLILRVCYFYVWQMSTICFENFPSSLSFLGAGCEKDMKNRNRKLYGMSHGSLINFCLTSIKYRYYCVPVTQCLIFNIWHPQWIQYSPKSLWKSASGIGHSALSSRFSSIPELCQLIYGTI